MEKLIIEDTTFSHSVSSSWYNPPKKFIWDRNTNQEFDSIVITNLSIIDKYPNKKVYGWIIEPPAIWSSNYDYAKNNFNKFEKIFTYDKNILEISEKFIFLPHGGCWIDEESRKIYEKNKLVSFIASTKNMGAYGHNFRSEIRQKINRNMDSFGRGHNPIENKLIGLKDYMFSIVVENSKIDYYFTEKIVDCFMTGTIPIYWGCPSIGDFFDLDGIIVFDTINELDNILENLTPELYIQKKDSILRNFEISKEFIVADDIIYEKLKK